jgi:hypothetical protein
MIKSRRMRWVGERRNTYKISVEKPEGKKPLGLRTILKWILDK